MNKFRTVTVTVTRFSFTSDTLYADISNDEKQKFRIIYQDSHQAISCCGLQMSYSETSGAERKDLWYAANIICH